MIGGVRKRRDRKGYDRCQWEKDAASLKLRRRASACLSLLDMPSIGTFPQAQVPRKARSEETGFVALVRGREIEGAGTGWMHIGWSLD